MWLSLLANRNWSEQCRFFLKKTQNTFYFTILSSSPQPFLFTTNSSKSHSLLPTQSSSQGPSQQNHQMMDLSRQEIQCLCIGHAWPRPFSVSMTDLCLPLSSGWLRLSQQWITELWSQVCFLSLNRNPKWGLQRMAPHSKSSPKVKCANKTK